MRCIRKHIRISLQAMGALLLLTTTAHALSSDSEDNKLSFDLLPQEETMIVLGESMADVASAAANDVGCKALAGFYPVQMEITRSNEGSANINFKFAFKSRQTAKVIDKKGIRASKYEVEQSRFGLLFSQIILNYQGEYALGGNGSILYAKASLDQQSGILSALKHWTGMNINHHFITSKSGESLIHSYGLKFWETKNGELSAQSKWRERMELQRPTFQDGILSINREMISVTNEPLCKVVLTGRYNQTFGAYTLKGGLKIVVE